MKPLLSDNGSGEIGYGLLLAVFGALYYVFTGREAGAFESGAVLSAGLILACYGYGLRKAWNDKIRQEFNEFEARLRADERERRRSSNPIG